MISRHLSSPATLIVVALSFCLAHGQQSNSTADNARATVEARREKAFDLLKSLASQVPTLRSAENRARLGSNIAAALWEHDERLARSLVSSVEGDIKAGLESSPGEDFDDEKTRMVFFHLRVDTVLRIAKHDGELAVRFLEATEVTSIEPRSYVFAEMKRNLEMQLAREIASAKPEVALKLGRRQLERGFSNELLTLLSKLRKKDKEPALILYREIVSKLRDWNLGRSWEAFHFAMSLAHSFPPPATDEASYRELINLLFAAGMEYGCANKDDTELKGSSYFCSQIGSLVPQMERIDPERAAALRRWRNEAYEPEWPTDSWKELTEIFKDGNVDEILALVSKYPQMERQIYSQAIQRAYEDDDFARVRKIATEYRGDPEIRKFLIAQAEEAEKFASMNDEKLAEIQATLNAIPRGRNQVMFLLMSAQRFGTNNRKTTLKLLDQAHDVVNSMKAGKEQTEAQMALAASYCLEKSDRGLALMESLMPKLNELIAASVQLDGYESHNLRDGEWNMSDEGAVGSVLTRLAQGAGYFAWCDLDRALNVAGQFERPEIRMMAQLKLAQGILAGPPKRLSSRRPY